MRRVRDLPCGDLRIYLEVEVRRVACRTCGRVRQERLDWLAANPHYTKRFALYVGKQCRGASIKEVCLPELRGLQAHGQLDLLHLASVARYPNVGPRPDSRPVTTHGYRIRACTS